MVAQRQKIGVIVAGTLLSISFGKVEPVQAAGFTWSFVRDGASIDSGNGFLQFENTSLTGIGQETTSFSQISQENDFVVYEMSMFDYFGGYNEETQSPFIYYNYPVDATLNLNNGNWAGINFVIEDDYASFGGFKDYKVDAKGKTSFVATGDRYQVLFTGTATISTGFVTGEITTTTTTYNNDPIESGSIVLTSSDPITPDTGAVPEPLTCMGALTALGFGIALKRKLARKS